MKRILSFILAMLTIAFEFLAYGYKPYKDVSDAGFVNPADPIYFTAHRGAHMKAPENSLPAYEQAIEMGYYTVETDIRLTKDNVWVISHNDSLEKWYHAKVNISEHTYEELLKYKVKSGNGLRMYGTLRLPTLEEYLDLFIGKDSRPQIEIKSANDAVPLDEQMKDGLRAVVQMLEERDMVEQAILISFHEEQLTFLRELCPDLEIWYLCGKVTEKAINTAKEIGGNVWLSCAFDQNTIETMQKCIDSGLPISMWTVDTIQDAKALYEAGFRYMETDKLCP